MTALMISFWIAIIPPIIGAVFVPETLGMRQIDFNAEKNEEKLQIAMSREENGPTIGARIMSMLSGDERDNINSHGYVEMKNSFDSGNSNKDTHTNLPGLV